jgi:hypothetical protein
MNITIKIVPADSMRPEVDGVDWFWTETGNLEVQIAPIVGGDWRDEALLGIHEAIEALICKHIGVSQQAVDKFDQAYDAAHPNEPDLNAGDDPLAPYDRAHTMATACERALAFALDVQWGDYDKRLATLYPGPSKRAKKNEGLPRSNGVRGGLRQLHKSGRPTQ